MNTGIVNSFQRVAGKASSHPRQCDSQHNVKKTPSDDFRHDLIAREIL
jgi:hypothetical protein